MERGQGVEEMQGLYGPYILTEKVIQQVWARGDFDRCGLRLLDGRALDVLHPGRWNAQGGPDFMGARLRIAGSLVEGDVEVHAREEEWRSHGHAFDPAYSAVVLHVVLFPSRQVFTEGWLGSSIPVLELLPRLLRDLEDYAVDSAIERLAGHPLSRAFDEWRELSPESLRSTLRVQADLRWRRKVDRARRRSDELGWEGSQHVTAMEILGYSANRAPMMALAHAHPLDHWVCSSGRERDWLSEVHGWVRQGVRAVNLPEARAAQYSRWVRTQPRWPDWLRGEAGRRWPTMEIADRSVGAWRRRVGLPEWSESLRQTLTGGHLGGTRWETCLWDGVWPALAAGGFIADEVARRAWGAGYAGDVPREVAKVARALRLVDGGANPMCVEWAQGILGWLGAWASKSQVTNARSFEGGGT